MDYDTPHYYMPYDSESDTGSNTDGNSSDEDYDSDDLPDFEDPRIRREEDPRYAIIRTAGPSFNTSEQQMKYMEHMPGSAYDTNTNITTLSSLVYLNPPKTTQTSLFSIKSSNRDTTVWPSPFRFKLKTPRVYKNVTKFQLVQISFPNNTSNIATPASFNAIFTAALIQAGLDPACASSCINVTNCGTVGNTIGLVEDQRINSSGYPFITTLSVPSGNYNNAQIANEITQQANSTPPLNIISYDEFRDIFKITRDISVLFNEPGDYFVSKITKKRLKRHTKIDIMNEYYSQQHIDSFSDITDKIAFNAYYYPILKELIATERAEPFINTNGISYSQVTNLIMNQFLGLDSDIYYNLGINNKGALDAYRKHLTFELRHINKYIWSYNEDAKSYNITHDSLHTSLQNDINNKYTYYFNQELTVNGFNIRSFNSLKSLYSTNNAIFKTLESYLSTQFANYFLGGEYKFIPGNIHSTTDGAYSLETLSSIDDGNFNNMFGFSDTFGNIGNLSGVNLRFRNFMDYHSTISSYYNIVNDINNTITTIQEKINTKHHSYVANKYKWVLPQHIIDNRSYLGNTTTGVQFIGNKYAYFPGESLIDPNVTSIDTVSLGITDDCQKACCEIITRLIYNWYGCLPVNTIINSLQYRLGIPLIDFTNFSVYNSIVAITSTQNFNFFMQINPEQNFNNMDVAMTENYAISNETTGQVKLMAAKILTAGVAAGEVTETAIQNPIVFETPLGKLDNINISLYADDAALTPLWKIFPFDLGINEWDATFQIDEEVAFSDRNTGWGTNPTIPIPNNPAAFQYMALTSTNNPNNK